jgi:hypothetical protein
MDACHVQPQRRDPGGCATCHNGSTATGKPGNHLPTTQACDVCHRTTAWVPATFNHSGVTPGGCATCHNGSRPRPASRPTTCRPPRPAMSATAPPPGCRPRSTTRGVTPGGCATCHNGSTATGKPANHIPTTQSCDTCHRTTAWIPATFNHSGVTPGACAGPATTARPRPASRPTTCRPRSPAMCVTAPPPGCRPPSAIPRSFRAVAATCHNGVNATGKPGNHFVTTRACDACHRTSAWMPLINYVHTSIGYRAHAGSMDCNECHRNNNEVIAYQFTGLSPELRGLPRQRLRDRRAQEGQFAAHLLHRRRTAGLHRQLPRLHRLHA